MAIGNAEIMDETFLLARVRNNFQESVLTIRDSAETLTPLITRAAAHMIRALLSDHKILACGNGGPGARGSPPPPTPAPPRPPPPNPATGNRTAPSPPPPATPPTAATPRPPRGRKT